MAKSGKLSRSEVVTVRLDPRLRYGVDLAGRKHRRTASSFIEWAIEQALHETVVRENNGRGEAVTVADALSATWDVDDADRLIKLALHFPEMLTHEEQVLWKVVREYASRCGVKIMGKWDPTIEMSLPLLREHWETFKQVANRERPASDLPKWQMPPKTV